MPLLANPRSRLRLYIPGKSPCIFLQNRGRNLSVTVIRSLQQQPAKHDNRRRLPPKIHEKLAERDLFLSILSTSTTKRDAKSYLSRYQSPSIGIQRKEGHKEPAGRSLRALRIALIKIRGPQSINDETLQGVAHTFAQLSQLGLSCVFVVDCEQDDTLSHDPSWRRIAMAQADRLVAALGNENNVKARRLDCAFGVAEITAKASAAMGNPMDVFVQYPNMVFSMIEHGTIPVIPAIGYTTETQKMVAIAPNDVVIALTQQFTKGASSSLGAGDQNSAMDAGDQIATSIASVERIILLDPLGGLPSAARRDKSHVFVNLVQEYKDIRKELLGGSIASLSQNNLATNPDESASSHSIFGISNPFTTFLENERPLPASALAQSKADLEQPTNSHVKNLDLLQSTLPLLPLSSSALLTTPHEAATLTQTSTDLGVITRRPKNPLIFNLLTDKPVVSSSLPEIRLGRGGEAVQNGALTPNGATFVKLGLPLTIIPDPRSHAWEAPTSDASLSLEHVGLDMARLVALIEDSFGQPLDLEHYLNRIRHKLAGVIIAGDYEGGAILTWELPPGVPDNGTEASRQRMVPYLDKFAVLRKSQGTGGVADIVFSAMVRMCFPNGVCWRSRKGNPVNKWYFDRSNGTWKIPNTQWTMFWTTPDLLEERSTFLDYESVCRTVVPSWADKRALAD